MVRPPRLGFVVIFVLSLLVGGVGLAYWGINQIRLLRTATTHKPAVKPPQLLFPIQDESEATAGLPLRAVIHGLDFDRDPNAMLTFDLAMQTRLRKGHYQELDMCATDLEQSKARVPGGGWQFFRMIEMLSNCPGGEGRSEEEWGDHLRRLRDWMAQRPDSSAARESMAMALINFGWKARGREFANSVSPEDWKLFEDRLEQASALLNQSGGPKHRSPMWYYDSLIVARGLSRPRQEYDRIFTEGINQEPGFFGLYSEKAYNLLPRWDGEPGEWERFAKDASDHIGGTRGDGLYFFIIRFQCESIGDKDVLSDPDIDWTRAKRGWASLCSDFGKTNYSLNEYCVMAGMKGDRSESLAILEQIGNNWDSRVWHSRATFEDFSNWTHQTGAYANADSRHPWSPTH